MTISKAALLLYFCSAYCLACSPAFPDPKNQTATADAVLIGYVTGEHLPDYESHLIASKDPVSAAKKIRRVVRVTFVIALKGKLSEPIEIEAPCSGPFPNLEERVIVVRWPSRDIIFPADYPELENEFTDAASVL